MFQNRDFWIGLAVGAVAGVFGYRFMQEREQAREAAREALYNDESGEVVALEQQLIDEALNEISDKDIKQKERENITVDVINKDKLKPTLVIDNVDYDEDILDF